EPRDDLTLDAFLRSGMSAFEAEVRSAARRLGIGDLLSLSLIKLSNGQVRRARIARALLSRPELLILVEPFMGLDVAGRQEVTEFLGTLVHEGLRVGLITRPETVPAWVTHVLELEVPFGASSPVAHSRIRQNAGTGHPHSGECGYGQEARVTPPSPLLSGE